jgi:hypothetical protein
MGCGRSRPSGEEQLIPFAQREWRPLKRRNHPILDATYCPASTSRVLSSRQSPNSEGIYDPHPLLRREDLLQGLRIVAEYLRNKSFEYTIIVAGGALNTIHLQSRETTEDIDFFFDSRATERDVRILEQAASHTVERMGRGHLRDDWLNSRIIYFIPRDLWPRLVLGARKQNTIVFQHRGLTVLAAPWSYSFIAKVERMLQQNAKDYDGPDAAQYLHQHVLLHGNKPVTLHLIRQWAAEYGRRISDSKIRQINTIYRHLFGTDGIRDFEGKSDR